MKKLLLLFTLMLTVTTASAYDFEIDGIYYRTTSDATVTVRSCDNIAHVIIPDFVVDNWSGTGYAVTEISPNAFWGGYPIESVSIGNSVVKIGKKAGHAQKSVDVLTKYPAAAV